MKKKALNKAMKIIEEIIDDGNLKKCKLTPNEFFEFSKCVYDFYRLENPCVLTISKRVKDLLVKCGFSATEEGIGWQIN